MHVHPPSPPCASPPRHVHPPPPQPEKLVMGKDETVGNKKKMQVCLPKNNYKLDNNLLTVEPRAVFDADPELDPDPAHNLTLQGIYCRKKQFHYTIHYTLIHFLIFQKTQYSAAAFP
jgi:hypothetical protein